jgi:hypothetical protein
LIASSLSQRQTVAPLIEATMPLRTASRAISAWLKREKGRFLSPGSSHANAFTSITISGGKMTGPTLPWTILQTGHALFKKPFTPLADDLSWQAKAFTDFFILKAIGGKKDNLSADNFKIR